MSALGFADDATISDQTAGGALDIAVNGDRLARSRERVRRVLTGDQTAASQEGATRTETPPNHTMRRVAQLAARRAVETLADRHPLPLIGVAFAAGGLLILTRPWGLLLRPALIAGIAARLIAHVPADTAVDLVTGILHPAKPRAAERRRNSSR